MSMKHTEFKRIRDELMITVRHELTIEKIKKSGRSIPKGLQKPSKNTSDDVLRFCRDAVNAKKSNDRFTVELTVDELFVIASKTLRCPICGCALDYQRGIHCRKNNGASLDRKFNENVVNKDNVWVICSKCNTTKSDRTIDEFIEYMRTCLRNLDAAS